MYVYAGFVPGKHESILYLSKYVYANGVLLCNSVKTFYCFVAGAILSLTMYMQFDYMPYTKHPV